MCPGQYVPEDSGPFLAPELGLQTFVGGLLKFFPVHEILREIGVT